MGVGVVDDMIVHVVVENAVSVQISFFPVVLPNSTTGQRHPPDRSLTAIRLILPPVVGLSLGPRRTLVVAPDLRPYTPAAGCHLPPTGTRIAAATGR